MTRVRWVVPEASAPRGNAVSGPAVRRNIGRQQIRIGLLENTKDNAALLLGLLGADLAQALGAEVLPLRRKANPATGAPVAMLDELAREADLVLSGMAD